jgi:hypothetical protein
MFPTMLAWVALFACNPAAPGAAPLGPAATEMVEVAAEGTRFDPPVMVARIPDGAWMCDMGTVHYAARSAGECPICGMDLTQKGAPTPGGHEDHDDHD